MEPVLSEIVVFYLARLAEGLAPFAEFANSYRRHPAGVPHKLVVICKGFRRPSEFAALASVFKGIDYETVTVRDDIGQDIHAYRAAMYKFRQPVCCFLNTFSVIESDDWLLKLHNAMQLPNAGLVGATASYESLNNSWEVLDALNFALNRPSAFDLKVTRSFEWIARHFHPITVQSLHSRRLRLRRMIGDKFRFRPTIDSQLPSHRKIWAGADYHFAKRFSYFPNPHIRSNAFMARREDVLKARLRHKDPKVACCLFESGPDGLSGRVLKQGRRLLMVGADGRAFDVHQWPTANCFRSGNQQNLLVSDNQTRATDSYSNEERFAHSTMTWGEYLPNNGSSVLGVPFNASIDLEPRQAKQAPPPLISVVIPTHNRNALLLDTLETIRHQDYDKIEIAVFDNASEEPVSASLAKLGDTRIKCERSDKFLPVTDSWNRAISMATGDYVILIGDDDGLCPGYFKRIAELSAEFEPDLIVSSLIQFFHPGVWKDSPAGYVQTQPIAAFMSHRDRPFILSSAEAKEAVANSLVLRRSFMFNMPGLTVGKGLLKKFGPQVFRPPFPDYHFANFVLHQAQRIVAEPRPISFQGISTSSFGFTLFNQRTDEGFKTLGHDLAPDKRLLPGDDYLSHYTVTMMRLADDIGGRVDIDRYRAVLCYRYFVAKGFNALRRELWPLLSFAERARTLGWLAVKRLKLSKLAATIEQKYSIYSFTPHQRVLNEGDFVSNSQLYSAIAEDKLRIPL